MFIPSFYSLQQCDMITVAENTMPYVKSYYSCLNRVIGDGYSEEFFVSKTGVKLTSSGKEYGFSDFKVINMFRFEGSVNSSDNVLMYMLETLDGKKGTLIVPNTGEQDRSLFTTQEN